MAEIIDILSTFGDESQFFTVNTAVKFVTLTASPSGDGFLKTAEGKDTFQPGDNFILLSIGCLLPIGFEFYEWKAAVTTSLPNIHLKRKVGAGLMSFWVPNTIWLPFGNYELNMGVFFEAPVDLLGFKLASDLTIAAARISMIGVPAALNTDEFRVPIFWKVLHTLAIQ